MVGVVDEFFDFFGFEDFYEGFDAFAVFVAFFNGDDVYVFFDGVGVGGLCCEGIGGCVETGFEGVVSVDYGKVKIGEASGDLFCCEFHEFDFVGVFFDVVYGCGDACAVIEGDQALFL